MTSDEYDVQVLTNTARIAEEVTRMTARAILHSAAERGAKEQWKADECWILETITTTERSTPMYWGDLTGEPLDSAAVQKARDLEIKYFRKTQVYDKVPVLQA